MMNHAAHRSPWFAPQAVAAFGISPGDTKGASASEEFPTHKTI
jgi:hypothetical protein